ncbi:hypothetical protein LV779_37330 [Streptomyces thinghirensis]|nr:hypothetical protein [Streptomyces thinghirensis]
MAAREALEAEGTPTRVVSMPSVEWFEEQPREYRESVLPPSVKARVAVEAGIGLTWHRFTGGRGPHRLPGALRRLRRRRDPVHRVRLHRGARGRRRQGVPGRRPR